MKLKLVVFCISFSLLLAADAAAQWAQEVTSWYVETPYGLVGYREIDFGGGAIGILGRYLELGPLGSITLTKRVYAASILAVATTLLAIAALSIGRRRRRASESPALARTIDVTGTVE
jgi:hypothetical protein